MTPEKTKQSENQNQLESKVRNVLQELAVGLLCQMQQQRQGIPKIPILLDIHIPQPFEGLQEGMKPESPPHTWDEEYSTVGISGLCWAEFKKLTDGICNLVTAG
jgi:hypothetical protein